MSETYTIDAKVKEVYSLVINGLALGDFVIESKWEGLTKFRSIDGGDTVIGVNDRENFVATLFSGFGAEDRGEKFALVMASPSILALIATKKPGESLQ